MPGLQAPKPPAPRGNRSASDASARSVSRHHPEGEVSLGDVAVHGKHAPDHFVDAGRQRGERDPEKLEVGRIHLAVALVYLPAGLVEDAHRAEGGLEALGEPDSDLRRGCFDDAPAPGVGAVEERMGFHAGRPGQDEGEDDETRAAQVLPSFVMATIVTFGGTHFSVKRMRSPAWSPA